MISARIPSIGARFGQRLDCLDRVVMPLDVEMIAHGFATCSQSMQDQATSLAQGDRVSLDGVGVVISLDPELLPDSADQVGGERATRVQLVP